MAIKGRPDWDFMAGLYINFTRKTKNDALLLFKLFLKKNYKNTRCLGAKCENISVYCPAGLPIYLFMCWKEPEFLSLERNKC